MKRNIDYHIHPNYSIDAKEEASIEEYCNLALKLKMDEICFTTHIDYNPLLKDELRKIRFGHQIENTSYDTIKKYINECSKAKYKYFSKGLRVYIGAEIDYSQEYETEIMNNIPWELLDFKLLGIHYFNGQNIVSPCYEKKVVNKTAKSFIFEYYKKIMDAINLGVFDSVAHIDLYKRFLLPLCGDCIYEIESEVLPEVFMKMGENNIAIEINTSQKKDWCEGWFPNKNIIKKAYDMGVDKFTVGSDCHIVEDLGYHTIEAIAYGQSIGLKLLDLAK